MAAPVSVSVASQGKRVRRGLGATVDGRDGSRKIARRDTNDQIESAFEVSQDPLHGFPMARAWVVKVTIYNGDREGKIRASGAHEVREATNAFPVRHFLHAVPGIRANRGAV